MQRLGFEQVLPLQGKMILAAAMAVITDFDGGLLWPLRPLRERKLRHNCRIIK